MLLRTPAGVTAEILYLCQRLNTKAHPEFIRITPEPGSLPRNCFWNVRRKAEAEGGRIQYGWAIWEWPRVFIEAEHHAVYEPPAGRPWADITPSERDTDACRFFLPDDAAVYDFNKRSIGLGNVRQPLADDPLIQQLFRLKDERVAFESGIKADIGQRVVLEGAEREFYLQNERQMGLTQSQLAMKYTPQGSPCPCGSGQKFKRCHGRARQTS